MCSLLAGVLLLCVESDHAGSVGGCFVLVLGRRGYIDRGKCSFGNPRTKGPDNCKVLIETEYHLPSPNIATCFPHPSYFAMTSERISVSACGANHRRSHARDDKECKRITAYLTSEDPTWNSVVYTTWRRYEEAVSVSWEGGIGGQPRSGKYATDVGGDALEV